MSSFLLCVCVVLLRAHTQYVCITPPSNLPLSLFSFVYFYVLTRSVYGMFLGMLLYWQNILWLHGLVARLFPWNALKIDLFVSLLVFTDRRIPTGKSGVRHLKIEICWNYTPTTQKKTKPGRRGEWDVQGHDECDHQLPPHIPSRAETGKKEREMKSCPDF